jgi:hypothetical protein
MEKKPLQSLNDTDKQFMNIDPNYLSKLCPLDKAKFPHTKKDK